MNTMSRLTVEIPEPMNKRLESVKDKTGLNKSEITRRGIHEELRNLEECDSNG